MGFGGFGFHVVFGCQAVEVAHEHGHLFGIGYVALVHSYANHEVVLVGILQSTQGCIGLETQQGHHLLGITTTQQTIAGSIEVQVVRSVRTSI